MTPPTRRPRLRPWRSSSAGSRTSEPKGAVMGAAGFNAPQYKRTTRVQWEAAAQAWDRWDPTLTGWLGAATDQMLDLAGVDTGAAVLDVAAGAGGQTLAAALRVGPTGR